MSEPDNFIIDEDGSTENEDETENLEKVGYVKKIKMYPKSVWFIMGNEFCERFSFYGLKAILAIYLSDNLGYSDDTATAIIHTFIFFAYFTSLPGGYMADAYLGKYKTILYISLVYCLGSATLSVFAYPDIAYSVEYNDEDYIVGRLGNVLGLILVAIGTGGIKACVSSFVGDQFKPEQARLLENVFGLFYFAINFGSLISTFSTPLIREYLSPWIAFGLPAILLIVALIIFVSGSKKYTKVKPQGSVVAEFLVVLRRCFMGFFVNLFTKFKFTFWSNVIDKHDPQVIEDVKSTLKVFRIYLPLPIFWALFDQHASRWVFQAKEMYLPGINEEYRITADQIPVLNPLFTLILLPVFDGLIYPLVRKCGIPLKPLTRMSIGMVITVFSFLTAALLQFWIDNSEDNSINVGFQVPQYFLLSCGEIMVSVTGLEFSYTEAPKCFKSVVMSSWLLTTAFGNIFVAIIAEVDWPKSSLINFLFYAALLFIFDVIFTIMNWGYKYREIKKDPQNEYDSLEDDNSKVNKDDTINIDEDDSIITLD